MFLIRVNHMEAAAQSHEDAEKIAEDGGLLLFPMDTRTSARMTSRAATGNASLVTGQEVFYPTNLGQN